MTASPRSRKKIAVLGGGVGALSAAFALTDWHGWDEQYEVTVYQMGWRLGGKGASGRNAERAERIEEHGLHVWMGCYENAFRLMQCCYAELGRTPGSPLADWTDAFKPHNLVTLMEPSDGRWVPWACKFPTNGELPGKGGVLLKPWDYVRMLLSFLVHAHEQSPHAAAASLWGNLFAGMAEWVGRVVDEVVSLIKGVYHDDRTGTPLALLRQALQLAEFLPADPLAHKSRHHAALQWLMEQALGLYDAVIDPVLRSDELRRLWVMTDLAVTVVRGLLSDGALYRGLDLLDDYDLREWLRRHGASDEAVWSAPVRAVYDLVFAYEKGDPSRPNLAAGVALRTLLRTGWTYKGAFAWKMQAGMGDVVFAPLYEVLRRRGVKFRFFHRVENLGLSADRTRIDTINVTVQATVKEGEYRPLVDVKGLPCWPSAPLYEQLAEGEELKQKRINLESAWAPWPGVGRKSLRCGEDFDLVVLGISLAGLPYLARELTAASPRWRDMLANVQTVQTQALQLWLARDVKQLGWSASEPALVGSFSQCWADMTHLLPAEGWAAADGVKNVAYFCGALGDAGAIPAPGTDPTFPDRETERARQESLAFLRTEVGALWPAGVTSAGFCWDALVDPSGGAAEARFDAQYWRANVDPTERYVLSVKGSTRYRLVADESGFANLYLAGDWTRNGLNAGCVEAAVISGLQASRAICGYPWEIIGEKDL